MKSLKILLQLAKSYLESKPVRYAEEIISFILQIPLEDLYLDLEQKVSANEENMIWFYLEQCKKDKPLEYILKTVAFLGYEFQVDSRALIPRPETEVWLDWALKQITKVRTKGKVLWDLCTGSGCLGIMAKLKFPSLQVILSDICEEALQLAYCNAKNLNAEVEIRRGNFLEPFEGEWADFVFCNPPYVSEEEYKSLEPSVRDYEPKKALVSEEKGLYFYRILSERLFSFLNPGASVFLEIGSGQGKKVEKLFQNEFFTSAKIVNDWAGHNRLIFLKSNLSRRAKNPFPSGAG